MLPTLPLGPLVLPTALLVYILGVWLALLAVDRAARRVGSRAIHRALPRDESRDYQPDPETYYGLAAAGLLGGFLGARLVFILLHWSSYDDNLLGIIWPLNSGYNAFGGMLIGAAAAFFYGRWRRLPLWPALDVLAPGLLVFLIAVSLADFLGGAGYGSLTGVPWGVTQFGVRRHAVQLYEALVGLAALGAWWAATSDLTGFGSPVRSQDAGRPFLWAVIVYAGGRLLVDAYRENAPLLAGGLHVVQVVALGVLLAAMGLLARRARRGNAT